LCRFFIRLANNRFDLIQAFSTTLSNVAHLAEPSTALFWLAQEGSDVGRHHRP
jgi:hypothetical protein